MKAIHTNLVITRTASMTVVRTTGGATITASPNYEDAVDRAIATSNHLWELEFKLPKAQKPQRFLKNQESLPEPFNPTW